VYVDGGYVFCTSEVAVDGGDENFSWWCQPGTYFCGLPGACAQCRSDADCADQDLPTWDPLRPHCDLDSGVGGYWGFCQQCVSNSDCVGQPGGTECDLNRALTEPAIETIGFETCETARPGCPNGAPPGLGGCIPSPCQTDADCAGAIAPATPSFLGYPQEAEPYCIGGSCSPYPSTFPAGFCPNCFCQNNVICADGVSVCNQDTDHCGCTSSAQCGGPWPVCELFDAGFNDDAGDLVGFCGCESDADCGDAGLRCLDLQANDLLNIYGGKTCLFTCTDPRFPGCSAISPNTPVCDATSGLCVGCETDADCRKNASGPSLGPYCRSDGQCGCLTAKDCPNKENCGGTGVDSVDNATVMVFLCNFASPLACTPDACGNDSACNVDSGLCATPLCYSSFDCFTGSFCDPVAGCTGCATNSDCFAVGAAAGGAAACKSNSCVATCASDADCGGNPGRSQCLTQTGTCVCAGDADCAKSPSGHTCDTTASDSSFGSCICTSSKECVSSIGGPGVCRALVDGGQSVCTTCAADSDCQTGFFCAANGACTPRCDDGGAGCMAPFSLCDTSNVWGADGLDDAGIPSGPIWCYPCLSADDCPAGEACNQLGCSSGCASSAQCRSGQVCGVAGTCQDSCDAGPCPAGQICAGQLVGNSATPGLCYQCLGPEDCPDGAGCNSVTHTCGSCTGPSSIGGPFECPPDAICSSYWRLAHPNAVCLQNCDHVPCQDPSKTCALFDDLTPFHKYCFGCLKDSDCADAGPGSWCDLSVNHTFACQPGFPQ
jgi:hypothetical protein